MAAAIFRILEPQNVQFRPPITESLCKLDKEQLKKFALHLIAELVNEQVVDYLVIYMKPDGGNFGGN